MNSYDHVFFSSKNLFIYTALLSKCLAIFFCLKISLLIFNDIVLGKNRVLKYEWLGKEVRQPRVY